MTEATRFYRRSPHVLLEWEGPDVVAVQCDTLRRFRVGAEAIGVLSRLHAWTAHDDLAAFVGPDGLDGLAAAGLVEVCASPGGDDGPDGWSPFDLAAHRRSNLAGWQEARVATRPGGGRTEAGPRAPGRTTALPPPPPVPGALVDVLARRRSVRSYGPGPLGLEQLSALLHHSVRITGTFDDEVVGRGVRRPFAAGGARAELEVYVVANDVDGLEAGAHRYDSGAHDLVAVAPCDSGQAELNRWVRHATGGGADRDPPAVLVVTAVFARLMRAYRGMTVGLVQKNTGALLQTVYLVATAIGMAPCAVGVCRDRDDPGWLGLDPLVEGPVAYVLLGPVPG